jgi:hypothetical protein
MLLKLSRLKAWLTLEDSAKYLSLVTGGEVRTTDLLQLALDEQIALSIMLPSNISAVEYTRNDAANKFEPITFESDLEGVEGIQALRDAFSAWLDQLVKWDWTLTTNTNTFYEPDFENVRTIFNLWKFPCFHQSGNREVIASALSRPFALSEECSTDNSKPKPIYVQNPTNQKIMCLVEYTGDSQTDEPEDEIEDEPEEQSATSSPWPKYARLTLPKDSFFCLKQDELQRFANSLNESEATPLANELEALPDDFRALYEALGADELPDLDLVIAAWRKFWKGRLPNDGEKYPVNAEVTEWVKSRMDNPEQGNSKAKAIASIIRPAWAPTGRQPNHNQ